MLLRSVAARRVSSTPRNPERPNTSNPSRSHSPALPAFAKHKRSRVAKGTSRAACRTHPKLVNHECPKHANTTKQPYRLSSHEYDGGRSVEDSNRKTARDYLKDFGGSVFIGSWRI